MKYEEFVAAVCNDIRIFLPGYTKAIIEPIHVDKVQKASYYGISVREENTGKGLSMDLAYWFSQVCEQGCCEYVAALQEISTAIQETFTTCRPDTSMISDYSTMRNFLTFQVVSTEKNEQFLQTVPHTNQLDLSIIYRFVTTEWSIVITNSLLEIYGVSLEQLHEDAMANSPVKFPVHVQGMNDFMKEFVWQGDSQTMNIPDFGMCFVTCENEYGASALFYPEFLEQVAKRFRGKFFILPSSIHELILVPDYGEDVKGLKEIVSDVNDNSDAVTEEDFLSNSVYHYDAKLHRCKRGE